MMHDSPSVERLGIPEYNWRNEALNGIGRAGVADEVVKIYVSYLESSVTAPKLQLYGIKRVELEPGASEEISFEITPEMMELVDNEGEKIPERGDFKIYIFNS